MNGFWPGCRLQSRPEPWRCYNSRSPQPAFKVLKTKQKILEAMEFSGERFVPECEREMRYEHWHRYAFAGHLVKERRVLDVASGEGYGTDHLARYAAHALGVDLEPEAVAHAAARYRRDNLSFLCGDCTRLPLQSDSVDAIVSFETIEHLAGQREMLAEFRRVLSGDGFLVLSSPNRKTYSDDTGYQNEFHVRELYREELLELLAEQFGAVHLLGQKLMFHSAIWDLEGEPGVQMDVLGDNGCDTTSKPAGEPLYYIALCAADERHLPAMAAGLSLFTDTAESVYAHYNDEVRRNIHARDVLAEYERRIQALEGTAEKD